MVFVIELTDLLFYFYFFCSINVEQDPIAIIKYRNLYHSLFEYKWMMNKTVLKNTKPTTRLECNYVKNIYL